MQQAISQFQLTEGLADTWVWHGTRFSARNVYHHLQGLEGTPDSAMLLKCCCLIWKRRIPLKLKIFSWLLLCQRLMTRSFRQRFCSDSSAECPLCAGVSDDCSHLFFECQYAQATWRAATSTSSLDFSTAESFWYSIARGPFRCAAEWHTIFASLWAIWLHQNEVVFRGRSPSVDAIQHDARGIAYSWNRGGSGLSNFVPL